MQFVLMKCLIRFGRRYNENIDVEEAKLPRARKVPKWYEIGQGESSYPDSPKDLYRVAYFVKVWTLL